MQNFDKNKKTILIVGGPTACGKSDFAVQCAKRYNGEIISCDSMQIYKGLDIGTAKITNEEKQGIPHYMIDVVESFEDYSVQMFVENAKKLIDDISSRGKLPIVAGGTGLYIRSLIYPYSFCGANKDENIRAKYCKLLEENGKEYLFNLLKEKDFEASQKIHLNDTKKIIRALEIFELTGARKTDQNNEDVEPIYNVIFVVLNYENREELYNRINLRVDKMFGEGLIEEFQKALKDKRLNRNCQSMQAIGYRELFDFIDGKIGLEETKELVKKNTRHYAKRQLTFFRGFKEASWFDVKNKEKIFEYLDSLLEEK